jgi:hypothetical protein
LEILFLARAGGGGDQVRKPPYKGASGGPSTNHDEAAFLLATALSQLTEKTEARATFDGVSEWWKGYE